jgi:hypothetical protein
LVALPLLPQYVSRSPEQSQPVGQDPAAEREELLLRTGHTERPLVVAVSLSGPLTVWRLVLRILGVLGITRRLACPRRLQRGPGPMRGEAASPARRGGRGQRPWSTEARGGSLLYECPCDLTGVPGKYAMLGGMTFICCCRCQVLRAATTETEVHVRLLPCDATHGASVLHTTVCTYMHIAV